jgi:hypothetical protein
MLLLASMLLPFSVLMLAPMPFSWVFSCYLADVHAVTGVHALAPVHALPGTHAVADVSSVVGIHDNALSPCCCLYPCCRRCFCCCWLYCYWRCLFFVPPCGKSFLVPGGRPFSFPHARTCLARGTRKLFCHGRM